MHEDFKVPLINKKGDIFNYKTRKDIDKSLDSFWVVYSFLFNLNNQIALSLISTDRKLPNLYGGKFGISVATILRKDELPLEAAKRSLNNEIGIAKVSLEHLGDSIDLIEGQALRKHSVYFYHGDLSNISVDKDFLESITFMPLDKFENFLLLEKDRISPTLEVMWNKYKMKIREKLLP